MRIQYPFDFFRRNILIAAPHHILHAIDEVEIAVFVQIAKIARVKPTVLQSFRGGCGIFEISFHDHRTLLDDFARVSRRQAVSRFIDDPYPVNLRGQRQPASAYFLSRQVPWTDNAQQVFRQAVGRYGLDAESLFEAHMHLRREQRHNIAQGIIGIAGFFRRSEQNLRYRAHQTRSRNFMRAHLIPKARGAELFQKHDAAPHRQHGETGMAKRVDVKKRQHAQHPVVLSPAQALGAHPRGESVCVLGQHDAFGPVRGTRSVGDRGEVFGVDVNRRCVSRHTGQKFVP